MSEALLVAWYREIPEYLPTDDADMARAGMQEALRLFRTRIRERYTEGTLQRMLTSANVETRRAAVLALGAIGGMASNGFLAEMLRDRDETAARLAAESLWEVWFRGGTDDQNRELQQIAHLPDLQQALAGLDDLVRSAPAFAEAINQRAILLFRLGEYKRSIADCETVLRLNPHHFGAQAGMAQCYLKLRKHRAALRAFRLALQINPTMDGVPETIRALEERLHGGGPRGEHLEG